MPELKTYRVFISHAWDYGGEYERLCNLLDNAPLFTWVNYSVPEDSPIHNAKTKKAIKDGLTNHIKPSQIEIVLGGMYGAYSDWMQTEMDIAVGFNKPILGIVPYGGERVPTAVQDAADEMVNWSTASIVSAIRSLAL